MTKKEQLSMVNGALRNCYSCKHFSGDGFCNLLCIERDEDDTCSNFITSDEIEKMLE